MQHLKIAYDAKRLFLNHTGLGNYSRNLIEGLSANFPEHKYLLFTPKTGTHFNEFGKKHPVYQPESIWKNLPNQLWRSYGITQKINQLNVDIYHGLSHELPFGIKTKCKTIVTIHDVIFKLFPQYYKPIDRFFYHQKIKHAVQTADKIVCISQQTADDLQTFYQINPEKLKVIYQSCPTLYENFIPNEEANLSLKKKFNLPEHFMLSVGMNPRKNIDILLDALAFLKSQQKDFPPLVLVGAKNVYQNNLRKKADELGLLNRIFFLENISNADLPHLYDMALFSVFPSVYEGFGIPLVESLLCKTAVITNKSGCFKEASGPGALYVNMHDKVELSEAIDQLSTDDSLKNNLATQGYQFVQKFNSKTISDEWIQVYRSIVE